MARLIILFVISLLLLLVGIHVVMAESMGYNVTVDVFNINGEPAITVPGVVYGILVNSTNMQRIAMVYMNNKSQLVFNGVLPGTYIVYVYYYPNSTVFNYAEYWGSLTIDVPEYQVYNFTRNMPWIMYVTSTFNIANDSFSIIVYINNNNTQEKNLTGKVTVYISNAESVLGASALSRSVNLSPGINPIAFNYMPTQQGTYYIYVVLNVTIPQPLGQSIVTDQHSWERIMAVYTVSFVESGLPLGTSWSIKLNSTIINTTSNVITLFLPKGTYEYYVEPIRGYVANVTSGNLTVSGLEPVIISIHFRRALFMLSGIVTIAIIAALIIVVVVIMALRFRLRNVYDDVATA